MKLIHKKELIPLFSTDTFFIVLGIFCILPFLCISLYNHPSADDFCFYMKSVDIGFWKAQYYWYMNWTAKYSSDAFLGLFPLSSKTFLYYKLIPIVWIILLLFSFYTLVRLIFTTIPTRGVLYIVSIFFILYLLQMPNICEGFYWLSGSVCYSGANIFTLLLFCSLIKLLQSKEIKYVFITIILMVIGFGFNELSMLLSDFILFSLYIIRFSIFKKHSLFLLIVLGFACCISLFIILCPGNSIRANGYPMSHQLGFSVYHAVLEVKNALLLWLPLTVVFAILLFDTIHKKYPLEENIIFTTNPFVALCLVLFCLFISFFTGYWSMGICLLTRTQNVVYFFSLLGFFYLGFVLLFYLKSLQKDFIQITAFTRSLLLLILFVSLYQTNNIRTAYTELFNGKASRYNKELQDRYKIIKTSKSDTCFVPEIINQPLTIYHTDITPSSKGWINECYDDFWKSKPIITKRKGY